MRASGLFIICLSVVTSFGAQAASPSSGVRDAAPQLLASIRPEDFSSRPRVADETPLLIAAKGRYMARASGFDRIDPGNMQVFGGQIGGNGVKGGAVVSLTWPTVR